jgi:5-formyltetrahydrofolate cyclo-ligase
LEQIVLAQRRTLRQQMRERRRVLESGVRQRAATRLAAHLLRLPYLRRARRVALYLPRDGEIDPGGALGLLLARGCTCYLPVIRERPSAGLRFARYQPGMALRCNRFGIPEPVHRPGAAVSARQLDVILMPLVAFDAAGNRLGMGGGYFDRTLAFLRGRRAWHRPRLVGVGFAFQQVPALPAAPWDVPLGCVVTEHGVLQPRTAGETPCTIG